MICIALGKHTEAEEIYRSVLEARVAALGELHMDTLKTSCNLGLVLFNLEKNTEAADVLRKTLHGLHYTLQEKCAQVRHRCVHSGPQPPTSTSSPAFSPCLHLTGGAERGGSETCLSRPKQPVKDQ